MFRLKDSKGAELCLAMTHEEIVTDIARKELRSYKQLPQIWYQIQTKLRGEPSARSGEDIIVTCPESGYAANLEKATSQLSPVTEMEPTGDGMPELVHTPGK